MSKYGKSNNTIVIRDATTVSLQRLWKSVENEGITMRCCSACAGDYEDPDVTDWQGHEYEDGDESPD
jgi:hypothetical protein